MSSGNYGFGKIIVTQ